MLKLHNAMWPGLVGKGDKEDQELPISLDEMLELTAAANVNGEKFDGVDLFLYHPHIDPFISEDDIKRLADKIASHGLRVGSLVAPVWKETNSGSAMGDNVQQNNFLTAITRACRIAKVFDQHGIRQSGVIRVDSAEFGIEKWKENPQMNTARIVNSFLKASDIAREMGQRLAAEGEICWAGMHNWKDMLGILESVSRPGHFGFQADLAHTYLYLLGYNSQEYALLSEGYTESQFWNAYAKMTDKLAPWTIDFHVAQNDGTVKGAGSHDKTGKHCPADDPNGKLDIVRCSKYWLKNHSQRGIKHICWDGCMFPNATLRDPETWNKILKVMIEVRNAVKGE